MEGLSLDVACAPALLNGQEICAKMVRTTIKTLP